MVTDPLPSKLRRLLRAPQPALALKRTLRLARKLAAPLAALAGAALVATPALAESRWRQPRVEKTWVERTWKDPVRAAPVMPRVIDRRRLDGHHHAYPARPSRWRSAADETALVNAALLRQSVAMSRAAAGPACESIVSGRTADCTATGGARVLGLAPARGPRAR